MDQPDALLQLRDLWVAQKNHPRRIARRPDDRNDPALPDRARLAAARRRGRPADGIGKRGSAAADGCGRHFDGTPALFHRRGAAPRLFDRRHAPVPRSDAPVPARGRGL